MSFWLRSCLGVVLATVAWGCQTTNAPSPPVNGGEPVGLQMLRTEAELKKYPFRTVLDFEAPREAVFVQVDGAPTEIDDARTHTGKGSLLLPVNSTGVTVRLPSLFSGSQFPGRWTLTGAYLYSKSAQRLTAVYEVKGTSLASTTVELPAGRWTPVLLDVGALPEIARREMGLLRFRFHQSLAEPVWFDDFVVLDNAETLVDWKGPKNLRWTVSQHGFRYVVESPGHFKMTLKSPELVPEGWRLIEANSIRAVFSSTGSEKLRVVYYDGRQFVDGRYEPLGRDIAQGIVGLAHRVPSQIEIVDEMGRVVRNSPGDSNNDGYAERNGTYQLQSNGPRLEFGIVPGGQLLRPVVEIVGLPPGKVTVNMEGLLVERTERTHDGRLLVALPGLLERLTLVSVTVKSDLVGAGHSAP